MNTWHLHKSQTIVDHHQFFVEECNFIHKVFKEKYPDKDSTWGYYNYNVFTLTCPSPIWYELYKELRDTVRSCLDTHKPLWFQCWLNFHSPNQVLDWHHHECPYNGYICIDPKSTRTVFEHYEVKNEIGNIYFGPGHTNHKVEVDEVFDGPRITLGFDIADKPERPFGTWNILPLL